MQAMRFDLETARARAPKCGPITARSGMRFRVRVVILALIAACRNETPERGDRQGYAKPQERNERGPTGDRKPGSMRDDMIGDRGMMGGRGMRKDMMGGDMTRDGGTMGGGMMGGEMMQMMDCMSCKMPEWMMSGEMRIDRTMMRDMHVIHGLLMQHGKIRREVEDIPGGVRTITTSDDPKITQSIRAHVQQMKQRVENGRAIRHMDPVFREIFEHHDQIEIQIQEVPGGVRVIETSKDPQVAVLIRQHARKAVSEFVESGMQRAMRPTPLPEGYEAR